MGTRSTVKFYTNSQEPILSVYHQYDGYICGIGYALANFLKDKKVINGIGSGQTMESGYANGMGCLAAQYILTAKTEIGGCYITDSADTQEYNYIVRYINGEIQISVNNFFKGTPQELLNFTENDN